MEPTASIIVIDHGDGGHCRLRRRSVVAAAMVVFVGGGMEPTVRCQSLSLMAAAKMPLLSQPLTAAADNDDCHHCP